MTGPTSKRMDAPSRFLALDLFRGLAVLMMFDAHITEALVSHDPGSAIHRYHRLLFNLPAPAFLFASGIAFGMPAGRNWEQYRAWTPVFRSRLWRLLQVLIVGYLLHLPSFWLSAPPDAREREIMRFLSMDILQCIAFGGVALLLLARFLPTAQWFHWACMGLAAAVSLASPVVWNHPPDLPWWLGTYFTKQWGSIFPLFPYVAFLFAGAAWGEMLAESPRAASTKRNWLLGFGLLSAGAIAARLPLPAPYDDFWNASPQFLVLRLGIFVLTLSVFGQLAGRTVQAARALLEPLGRESLLVYIAHIVIIYGSALNRTLNLDRMLADGVNFAGWLVLYALVTVAMIALAKTWTHTKTLIRGRKVFDCP